MKHWNTGKSLKPKLEGHGAIFATAVFPIAGVLFSKRDKSCKIATPFEFYRNSTCAQCSEIP